MAQASISQLRNGGNAEGASLFESLLSHRSFDPDAYHVMQERDDGLIRDELLHGAASKAFVYNFEIKGTKVTGISVVGARELAAQYKGIKSRIVATVEKRGSLFIFRTFAPLSIVTSVLHDLADEPDFYECVMEVSDIKTGNSIEVRKKELKTEKKRDGGSFDRPHYDVICESKAFRNGVLSVLPQSVILEFKARCLNSGNASNEQTIDQRRAAVGTFAARHGISLDRKALGELSFAELDGLSGAARENVEAFKRSVNALRLVTEATGEVEPPAAQPATAQAQTPAQAPAAASAPVASPAPAPAATGQNWEPSAEEQEQIRQRELAEASGTATAKAPAAAPQRRTRAAASNVE